MKKFVSKGAFAVVLALSIFFSAPQAEATVISILGATGTVVGLAQALQQGISNATEKANTQKTIFNQFALTSTPGSSSYMYRVSADELSRMVLDFNNTGIPCEVVSVSWSGSTIRAIRCTNEPYRMYDGSRLLGNTYSIANHFYSPGGYFIYAIGDDSAYSLYFIRSAIDTLNQTATAISNTVTTISSRISTLNGYVDGVEGLLDSVVGYLLAQSSKLSNIETYTSNISSAVTNTALTAARLIYTDSNNNTYSVGSMVYRIWQAMPTPQDYSSTLDLIRQYTLLTSNRLVYESGDVRMSASAILYDIRNYINTANSHLSNIANRTLNTANRLQTTVSGTTYSNADLLYRIWQAMPTPQDYSSTLDLIRQYTLTTSNRLLYENGDVRMSAGAMLYDIRSYVDGLESAFSTSNSHLQNIANRTLNTVSRLDTVNSNLMALSNKLDAIYGYMYIEESVTRAGQLVPVGIDQLVARGNALTGDVITNVVSLVSPVGLIQQGVQTIVDLIEDIEISEQNSILRNIYGTLHTRVNGVDYSVAQLNALTAERTNDIYEWLTSADLLDDNSVVQFVNSTGDYVNEAILNGNNIVSLFYHAYLNVIPSWSSGDPFGDAVQYFDDLYGGVA